MHAILFALPLGYRFVGYLLFAPLVRRWYGTPDPPAVVLALLRTLLGAISAGAIAGAVYLGWARAGFDHLDWRHVAPDAYICLWLGRAVAWAVTIVALFPRRGLAWIDIRAWATGMLSSALLDLPLIVLGAFGAGVFFVLTHILGQC